jgi:bifunctional non-homologous end joining protein LigD
MNRRAASLASVYSVRPQPGATVSAPVSWEEIASGELHPERFTMATTFDRLDEVGDLFAPVVDEPQDIDGALKTMGVKASRGDISQGRVRERMPSANRKRKRSA